MKKCWFVFLVMVLVLPLCGYTLKGGVTYTVEQARKEAFAGVQYFLPKSIIEANMFDPNFRDNIRAINNKITETPDRFITYFSDETYCVVYKKDLYYEFYYSIDGKLIYIGKRTGLNFPTTRYKYNLNGGLEVVSLYLNSKESFVFDTKGQLTAHWINNQCYDLNGKLILKSFD
ncbi:MAG: hypothetical protein KH321_04265 [Clostridium sp.]|nr:hypothetical protein [Clostridium sp.]